MTNSWELALAVYLSSPCVATHRGVPRRPEHMLLLQLLQLLLELLEPK
jgi:hypothetical protein